MPGGGNSILSAFSWEPLRANLQIYQQLSLASLLTNQPGCARALWRFCYIMTSTVINAVYVQGVHEQAKRAHSLYVHIHVHTEHYRSLGPTEITAKARTVQSLCSGDPEQTREGSGLTHTQGGLRDVG